MDTTLQFLHTYTIEQFKENQHTDKISVRENPRTNKLFLTWISDGQVKKGAVSKKGIPSDPIISEVADEEGNVFFLMHGEGQGAPIISTF